MLVVREATVEDIPRIVELGRQSLQDGPYTGRIEDNPEQFEKFARQVVGGIGKVLLWVEDDGKVTGLFGMVVQPHFFDGVSTAQEVIWYVTEESRAGGAAIKLLWAAEELAKRMGVKRMGLTAPNEKVVSLYQRFGYSPAEVAFERRF